MTYVLERKKHLVYNRERAVLMKDFYRPIYPEELKVMLGFVKGIKGRHIKASKALLILHYYTGAAVEELLRLRVKDIYKTNNYRKLNVYFEGRYKRKERTLTFDYRKTPLLKQVWEARPPFLELYIFSYFIKKDKKTGALSWNKKCNSANYKRYFKKWARQALPYELGKKISPKYFEQNRYYLLEQEGKSTEKIREFMGYMSIEEQISIQAANKTK